LPFNVPENPGREIEILPHKKFLEVRFLGAFQVPRFKRQVDLAVQACKERKLSLLLLDYTPLTGVPTTLDRYEISTHGAQAARGLTKLCGYARPEQVGDKFGALVARNRGLNVNVFPDRDEAVRWLLEAPSPAPGPER
jgi:hypothetical protein